MASSSSNSRLTLARELRLLHEQLNASIQQVSRQSAELAAANELLQLQYQEIYALRAKYEKLEAELERSQAREKQARQKHHESLQLQVTMLEMMQGRTGALTEFVNQCMDKSVEELEKV